MIRKIKKLPDLCNFIEDTCCEHGICVSFAEDIPYNSYAIIKVDKYYNSLNIEKRPPSIDCLIVRECITKGYGLTLVELKKTATAGDIELKNIKEKFETTLYDFIQTKFKTALHVQYSDIKLYFVSNIEIHKRDNGLKMDTLINLKFKFNGSNLMITPRMPNPTIKNCYS